MNKRLRLFVILILVSVFIPGCMWHSARVNPGATAGETTLKYKILEVPLFGQEESMWCWAASGEMIMGYYGIEAPQGVQADDKFNRKDCALKTGPKPSCNKGGQLDIEAYGFKSPHQYGALCWTELVDQIDADGPVGFSWERTNCERSRSGGSHYMVARGYIEVGDCKLVVVNDPLPTNSDKTKGGTLSIMTYRDYVQFCPGYVHSYTHRDIDITEDKTQKGDRPRPGRFISGTAAIKTAVRGNKRAKGKSRETTAALESLELLKSLPRPVLKKLGFTSKKMVKKISMGKPFYTPVSGPARSKPAGDELANGVEIHYPVKVKKKLVTTITIRNRGEEWAFAVIADWGAFSAAKTLEAMPPSRGDIAYFLVRIRSMNLTFLAYFSEEEGNKLYFVPTHEYPGLAFPLHEPVPAEKVFPELMCLSERMAQERGVPGDELKRSWEEMAEALGELGRGDKNRAIGGMNWAVEILDEIFARVVSRE